MEISLNSSHQSTPNLRTLFLQIDLFLPSPGQFVPTDNIIMLIFGVALVSKVQLFCLELQMSFCKTIHVVRVTDVDFYFQFGVYHVIVTHNL